MTHIYTFLVFHKYLKNDKSGLERLFSRVGRCPGRKTTVSTSRMGVEADPSKLVLFYATRGTNMVKIGVQDGKATVSTSRMGIEADPSRLVL